MTAAIDDATVTAAGPVLVQAESEAVLVSVTIGLAGGGSGGAGGGVQIGAAGSGSGNAITNHIVAEISGTTLNAGGDVSVLAQDQSVITAVAGALTAGGSGGAGGGAAGAIGAAMAISYNFV